MFFSIVVFDDFYFAFMDPGGCDTDEGSGSESSDNGCDGIQFE